MESRMDEFRAFVNKYPLLRDEVRSGRMTWQSIYEEWFLYGDNGDWAKYQRPVQQEPTTAKEPLNLDSIKSIVSHIQKINPDSLNKTLNTAQKVIQIAQTFTGNRTPKLPQVSSLYSDWWD